MYRTTPHSTTGVSQSELLFKRKIRTKLPALEDFSFDDLEVRDRDSEIKEKAKQYADETRNACFSDLNKGDKVLLKQEKITKQSSPFYPSPLKLVEKKGNQVTVESDQGVQYKRNVTDVKHFHPPIEYVTPNKEREKLNAEYLDPGEPIDLDPPVESVLPDENKEIQLTRPKRVSKLP